MSEKVMPIKSVILKLEFNEKEWDILLPGKLSGNDSFIEMMPSNEVLKGYRVAITEEIDEENEISIQPVEKVSFFNSDEKIKLEIGFSELTLRFDNYEKWELFKEKSSQILKFFFELNDKIEVKKLSLDYQNEIENENLVQIQEVSEVLSVYPTIPENQPAGSRCGMFYYIKNDLGKNILKFNLFVEKKLIKFRFQYMLSEIIKFDSLEDKLEFGHGIIKNEFTKIWKK